MVGRGAVTRATTRVRIRVLGTGISFAEGIKINENCSGHNSSSGDINATAGRERIRGAARNAADKEEMKHEGREREGEEPRDVFADENRYRETPTPSRGTLLMTKYAIGAIYHRALCTFNYI